MIIKICTTIEIKPSQPTTCIFLYFFQICWTNSSQLSPLPTDHLAKKPSPVFPWTTFFSRRYTADMARPGVDGFVKLEKKNRGENGKSWNPPKVMEVLMGFRWFFSFWKKTGDFLGSDLRFRVLYLVLFHGFESYIFILGDTGFLCTIRRNLWCIC